VTFSTFSENRGMSSSSAPHFEGAELNGYLCISNVIIEDEEVKRRARKTRIRQR